MSKYMPKQQKYHITQTEFGQEEEESSKDGNELEINLTGTGHHLVELVCVLSVDHDKFCLKLVVTWTDERG
jgi:hypothetical protein